MAKTTEKKARKKRPPYKTITRVLKLGDALSEGTGEVGTLLEEIGEWKDNMESNSMEQLPKYDEVSECHSTLEGVQQTLEQADEPTNEAVLALEVTVYESVPTDKRRSASRATRAGNAASCLTSVKEKLEEYVETLKDEAQAELKGELEELAGQLGEAADELSSVDFPGMY